MRTGAAALVLSVFAPRNAREIRRMLRPSGTLVVVTPTRRHLAELRAPLGLLTVDERKPERLDAKLGPLFTSTSQSSCEHLLSLRHDDLTNVVRMGPSARHAVDAAVAERVRALPEPMAVTASVTVSVYRRRNTA